MDVLPTLLSDASVEKFDKVNAIATDDTILPVGLGAFACIRQVDLQPDLVRGCS